jgi:hypothetical protein
MKRTFLTNNNFNWYGYLIASTPEGNKYYRSQELFKIISRKMTSCKWVYFKCLLSWFGSVGSILLVEVEPGVIVVNIDGVVDNVVVLVVVIWVSHDKA